jgi:hypothetical protein
MPTLESTTHYLETRYSLWKRRGIADYSVGASELKILEKAAKHCLDNALDPAMYFQAQVDGIDAKEDIECYRVKDFFSKEAIKRALEYQKARIIRDKALQVREDSRKRS